LDRRLHRIVKKDDHGPDALLCAMLPFPFIDEFDTAISQLLSGNDRERLKVTNDQLDGCISSQPVTSVTNQRCTMGVSAGASSYYVVISAIPADDNGIWRRRAVHIGRVENLSDVDQLMEEHRVVECLISLQPEPHLIHEWSREARYGEVFKLTYTNDGQSEPRRSDEDRTVTVDRTFALNSSFEEIKARQWILPSDARQIDRGEFYAQMKAPTRIRDMASGALRYQWTETGVLDQYRHAHAFDHLVALKGQFSTGFGAMAAGERESYKLFGNYDRLLGKY
jgi:hypothetical protein